MKAIQDAFMAPFSSTAASATTPMKTALAYVITGFIIGNMMKT